MVESTGERKASEVVGGSSGGGDGEYIDSSGDTVTAFGDGDLI